MTAIRLGLLATVLLLAAPPAARAQTPRLEALICPADSRVEARAPSGTALCLIQERVFREGASLVVRGLARNTSGEPMTQVAVSVEAYSFFGELLGVGHGLLEPLGLEAGQQGAFQAATLFREGVRRIRYRFSWQQAGEQRQGNLERQVTVR